MYEEYLLNQTYIFLFSFNQQGNNFTMCRIVVGATSRYRRIDVGTAH